jgi:hypothetical protein
LQRLTGGYQEVSPLVLTGLYWCTPHFVLDLYLWGMSNYLMLWKISIFWKHKCCRAIKIQVKLTLTRLLQLEWGYYWHELCLLCDSQCNEWSSHCFQKRNKKSGHRFLYNYLPILSPLGYTYQHPPLGADDNGGE